MLEMKPDGWYTKVTCWTFIVDRIRQETAGNRELSERIVERSKVQQPS